MSLTKELILTGKEFRDFFLDKNFWYGYYPPSPANSSLHLMSINGISDNRYQYFPRIFKDAYGWNTTKQFIESLISAFNAVPDDAEVRIAGHVYGDNGHPDTYGTRIDLFDFYNKFKEMSEGKPENYACIGSMPKPIKM